MISLWLMWAKYYHCTILQNASTAHVCHLLKLFIDIYIIMYGFPESFLSRFLSINGGTVYRKIFAFILFSLILSSSAGKFDWVNSKQFFIWLYQFQSLSGWVQDGLKLFVNGDRRKIVMVKITLYTVVYK